MTSPVRRRALGKEPALIAICLALLLLATVPPLVNLHRYQRRIAGAISRSIGRPVSMDSVALQLLPWPGLRISNLVVGEDPAFGAEPALKAPEVIAALRLSSLWRGRFELSRVDISDASVNLVRNPNGRWNVGTVLLQASQVSNAPTAQRRPGPAPRFPYLQATGIRINVKRGLEKLPYSLVNADFLMSLARPDVWRIKLEGQPVRTDLELFASDTGTLRLEGELHRASAFGTMPLAIEGAWNRLPLGQASRMLLGRDGGWRGDVDVQAQFRGEIDALDVKTHVVIANLHRQEFAPEQPFTVDATCSGHGSRLTPSTNELRCRWPLGRGGLTLLRSAGGWQLGVEKVPASVAAAAVGLLRPGIAPTLQIGGEFEGGYGYDPATGLLTGSAASPRITLAGPQMKAPLVLENVRAEAAEGATAALHLSADPLALGVPDAPMMLSSELWSHGYSLHAAGSATPDALRPATASFPTLRDFSSFGPADVADAAKVRLALTSTGPWLGAASGDGAGIGSIGAQTTGTVHLESVLWHPASLPFPVAFASADASVAPGLLRWSTPSATFGEGADATRMSGSVEVPLGCSPPDPCVTQFLLDAAALDARAVQEAFAGRESQLGAWIGRWNQFHSRAGQLPAIEGTVHAGVLTVGRLPVRDATLMLAAGGEQGAPAAAELRSFDGRLLGGTVHLGGSLWWGPPHYALHGTVAGVSVKALAALWAEDWGTGALNGTVGVSVTGRTTQELGESAKGRFQLSWLHGGLRTAAPLRFKSWNGEGRIDAKGLQLDTGTLSATGGTLMGTIGWNREIDLQLTQVPKGKPIAVGGTLDAPVEQAPE